MPLFRRFSRLARITILVALVGVMSGCLSPGDTKALTALNRDRAANGRTALRMQAVVQAKAEAWVNKLARENALYHSKLTDGVGNGWCALGENVGSGPTIAAVEAAYMRSPGHRANILSPKYNGAGVAVARKGDRIWVVQEFIKTC